MRLTFIAGRAAALCLLLAPAALCAQQSAAPGCELHFWPTADAMASSNIFVNPALQSGVTSGDALLDALPPSRQVAGLERLDLAGLLGMPGVRVVLASEPVSDRVAARQRSRLTGSTAPCYAELVVKRMGYRTDPFFGRDFGAVFIYRRFGPDQAEARIVQGGGDVSIRLFPPRDETQIEAAREEMTGAFGRAFAKFAEARLGPRR